MQADIVLGGVKEFRHLQLRQPDGLFLARSLIWLRPSSVV